MQPLQSQVQAYQEGCQTWAEHCISMNALACQPCSLSVLRGNQMAWLMVIGVSNLGSAMAALPTCSGKACLDRHQPKPQLTHQVWITWSPQNRYPILCFLLHAVTSGRGSNTLNSSHHISCNSLQHLKSRPHSITPQGRKQAPSALIPSLYETLPTWLLTAVFQPIFRNRRVMCLPPATIFCVLFPFLHVPGEDIWLSSTYDTAAWYTAHHRTHCTLLPSCMGALGNSHCEGKYHCSQTALGKMLIPTAN